jgi:D-arabinose 5-phosphate isomerase GutQ
MTLVGAERDISRKGEGRSGAVERRLTAATVSTGTAGFIFGAFGAALGIDGLSAILL